jgi:hypothetical protein
MSHYFVPGNFPEDVDIKNMCQELTFKNINSQTKKEFQNILCCTPVLINNLSDWLESFRFYSQKIFYNYRPQQCKIEDIKYFIDYAEPTSELESILRPIMEKVCDNESGFDVPSGIIIAISRKLRLIEKNKK